MHFWPGGTHRWPNLLVPPPNDVVRDDGPMGTILDDVQQYYYGKIGLAFAGTVFGLVHCLAWLFAFPTSAERIVWRAESLYTGLAFVSWPVPFVLILAFAPSGLGKRSFVVFWVLTVIANVVGHGAEPFAFPDATLRLSLPETILTGQSLTPLLTQIYAAARAALLVLVLKCLFHLPAEAFVLTWADKIPHFVDPRTP